MKIRNMNIAEFKRYLQGLIDGIESTAFNAIYDEEPKTRRVYPLGAENIQSAYKKLMEYIEQDESKTTEED